MSRDLDLDAVVLVTVVVLLVGTVAVATVPGLGVLVPPPLRGFGEFLGASLASWLVAFALGVAALVGLGFLKGRHRAGSGAETSGDGGADDGVDAAETGDGGAGSAGAEEILGGTLTEEYLLRRDDLRSRHGPPDLGPTDGLEHAAIAVQLARGYDAETAHERLRSGAWTDDPVAAAFLGDATAGSLSFRRRLYSVIYPHRAFERRFERTLEELEAAAERTDGMGGGFAGDGVTAGEVGGTTGEAGGTAGEARDSESDAGGHRDSTADGSDRADADRIAGGT